MHYVFVINGRSDKNFIASIILKQISELPSFTDYELYITKGKRDATSYVSSYEVTSEDPVCFVACGGDGTINEVASGLVGESKKYLAVMAYGTGNDFIKYYRDHDFKSVKALTESTLEKIDIIKVNNRYSINVCNFGFEAAVARIANGLPRNQSGRSIYRKALLRALLFNRNNVFNVSIDDKQLGRTPALSISFANCRYLGGEFLCAPRAFNNDGVIDFCQISTMNVLKLMPMVEIYKRGEHLDNPALSQYFIYDRVKKATISADHDFEACLDGEIMFNSHFDLEILPSAVNLLVPALK